MRNVSEINITIQMKWSITYYMGEKHSFTNYFTASRSFPFTKKRKKI